MYSFKIVIFQPLIRSLPNTVRIVIILIVNGLMDSFNLGVPIRRFLGNKAMRNIHLSQPIMETSSELAAIVGLNG